MVIYLKHPQHGTKVAISDLEATQDMRNGWSVFDPSAAEKPAEEPQPVETNALVRRGRKPKPKE